jgi:hypothetical protein
VEGRCPQIAALLRPALWTGQPGRDDPTALVPGPGSGQNPDRPSDRPPPRWARDSGRCLLGDPGPSRAAVGSVQRSGELHQPARRTPGLARRDRRSIPCRPSCEHCHRPGDDGGRRLPSDRGSRGLGETYWHVRGLCQCRLYLRI